MLKTYDYQEGFIRNIANKFKEGKKRIIGQQETSSGKTVVFANITQRYLQRSPEKGVLILVHRIELLNQARKTLYDWFGIIGFPVTQEVKRIPKERVYVGMAETIYNRVRKHPECLSHIGLLVCDEAHFLLFEKIFPFFSEAMVLGVTATPISGNKKKPLKTIYDDIVCGIKTSELIKLKKVVPCISYDIEGSVNRNTLAVRGDDFDNTLMGQEFSKGKHITNTVNAYTKIAPNTKAIVYNCNIEHSKLVHEAFIAAGYNSRMLDSKMCEENASYRAEIMAWLSKTPNAVLQNVAIAIAGLDITSIETIIFNCATKSIAKWRQANGRGARLHPGKEFFYSIDLGGNVMTFGEWSDDVDWEQVFWDDPKKKKEAVAPVKTCRNPDCACIIPAQSVVCKYCGHIMPREQDEMEEAAAVEFRLITKNINITELIERNKHHKEYYPFFLLGNNLASQARKTVKRQDMTIGLANKIMDEYHRLAKEWCKAHSKKYSAWHKTTAIQHLFKQLNTYYPDVNLPIPEDQSDNRRN